MSIISGPPFAGGVQPYETQVLVDGHPLALGQYGVWVSQYFPSFLIGGVEAQSGPGNTTPFANIAVGGTVAGITTELRARDPSGQVREPARRNALLPLVTMVGLSLPNIVGGAFITESVFNYPGMGLLGVDAIFQDDVPTLIGTVVVATLATVIGSLLADVIYSLLDPRIRYS